MVRTIWHFTLIWIFLASCLLLLSPGLFGQTPPPDETSRFSKQPLNPATGAIPATAEPDNGFRSIKINDLRGETQVPDELTNPASPGRDSRSLPALNKQEVVPASGTPPLKRFPSNPLNESGRFSQAGSFSAARLNGTPNFNAREPAANAPPVSQTFGDEVGDTEIGDRAIEDTAIGDTTALLQPQRLVPQAGGNEPLTLGDSSGVQTLGPSRLADQPVFDSSVRPAALELNPRIPTGNVATAASLLQRYQLSSYSEPLPGIPLTVREALEQTPVPNRVSMMVQYWETYEAWCRLIQARERVSALAPLNRFSGSDAQLIDGARALADLELKRSELGLHRAQQSLQRFLMNPQADTLMALPADQPLTEPYETQHEVYAARNRLPFEHRAIHVTLPKLKAVLDAAARACQINDDAWQQISQGNQAASLLQGLEQTFQARRQLVEMVVAYNQTIGDYSLKVAPWETSADRLAGMLVVPSALGTGQQPGRQAQLPVGGTRGVEGRPAGFNPAFQQGAPQQPITPQRGEGFGAQPTQLPTGQPVNSGMRTPNNFQSGANNSVMVPVRGALPSDHLTAGAATATNPVPGTNPAQAGGNLTNGANSGRSTLPIMPNNGAVNGNGGNPANATGFSNSVGNGFQPAGTNGTPPNGSGNPSNNGSSAPTTGGTSEFSLPKQTGTGNPANQESAFQAPGSGGSGTFSDTAKSTEARTPATGKDSSGTSTGTAGPPPSKSFGDSGSGSFQSGIK